MQQHRILSLLSILVMVIIPVVGWFLVAQPQLDAAAQADQQRTETEAQIQISSAVVAKLKEDSAKLPELNDDLNKLRTSIPADVDSEGYIDGLDALAQVAGVTITGLTVEQPMAYVPADVPVPSSDAAAADTGADTAETPAPAAPAAGDVSEANPAVVTSPLIDSSNFVAIPVTLELSGDWAPVLNFVDGLQTSPRLFLVTGLTTKLVEGSDTLLTAAVAGYIYAIPTGVEGKPRPISTTVKQLTAPVVVETVDEDAEDADAATPDPTNTPAP